MPNRILDFTGRLGNNIQQVAIGIMYAEYTKDTFEQTLDHEIIKKFSVSFGNTNANICNSFFGYTPLMHCGIKQGVTPPNSGIYNVFTIDYVYDNMKRIIDNYVTPNLNISKEIIDDKTLVIHIRSGDIFCESHIACNYIQNPLWFYLNIIKDYSDVLVITEPDTCNPIIGELKKIKKVRIQSTSVKQDFSTLVCSKNLVLSGIGTFGAAAALISNNLKNLYVSNLYIDEHLNYKMLKNSNVNIHIQELEDYQLKAEECSWQNSEMQRQYLLNYKMENLK